ncbi:MAG: hypothetical protein A2Z14_05925 [Chloroflexi bacterium RBG_16_48_8]|nr:MAG: hypothetical protein A2Z14_05925 [Chloroflexi bacterium RBG_16_48_8]
MQVGTCGRVIQSATLRMELTHPRKTLDGVVFPEYTLVNRRSPRHVDVPTDRRESNIGNLSQIKLL